MGIFNKQQDRYKDYNMRYNRPSMFGGFAFFPPVIKYLLITNVAVFLLQTFIFTNLSVGGENLNQFFFKYFALQPILTNPSVHGSILGPFMPWQLITYLFMHGGFFHLFLNMLALWMFGMELENIWGSRKFLMYYMMCGIGAGLSNMFLAPIFISVLAPTIGASGAIYGVLVAFGMMFPNRPIYIYFLFPIKAKYFVTFYMLIELLSVGSNTGIAHLAHLGGGVIGFLYILLTDKTNISSIFRFPTSHGVPKQRKSTSSPSSNVYRSKYYEKYNVGSESDDVSDADYYVNKERKSEDKELQEKIDEILDKISRDGYKSLTEEEKRILFEASRKIH
jgi:membrane associated rhomboid family serine protease